MDPVDSPANSDIKDRYDSLSLYHLTYDFLPNLKKLLSILEIPKELQLSDRFKKIESLLSNTFRLELIYRLHLIKPEFFIENHESEHEFPHPQLLLHFACLLECTSSVEYIAHYLGLTIEEVQELIRELHNTFSVENLVSRIREYYEENKSIKAAPELRKKNELLGMEPSLAPTDTTEYRRQRLRRRYGHLSEMFHTPSHIF